MVLLIYVIYDLWVTYGKDYAEQKYPVNLSKADKEKIEAILSGARKPEYVGSDDEED